MSLNPVRTKSGAADWPEAESAPIGAMDVDMGPACRYLESSPPSHPQSARAARLGAGSGRFCKRRALSGGVAIAARSCLKS